MFLLTCFIISRNYTEVFVGNLLYKIVVAAGKTSGGEGVPGNVDESVPGNDGVAGVPGNDGVAMFQRMMALRVFRGMKALRVLLGMIVLCVFRGMMALRVFRGIMSLREFRGNDVDTVQGNDYGAADGDIVGHVDTDGDAERKDRNNSDSNTPSAFPWID